MTHGRHASGRNGFTIIELLVTVAIIILLLGLLLVGLQAAARSAQVAQTKSLLSAINRALVSFKKDVGYYPPVLGPGTGQGTQPAGELGYARDLLVPPYAVSGSPTNLELEEWNSFTSLPEYLLGYGPRAADGYGIDINAAGGQVGTAAALESPALGIRHPGRDGVWGAYSTPISNSLARGAFAARNTNVSNTAGNSPLFRRKAMGPYLDLKDAVSLGGVAGFNTTTGEPMIVRASDAPNFESLPKVIVDYWGSPIRYFRRPYTLPDAGSVTTGFNVGDFFGLRPQSFDQGTDVDGVADGASDTSTSRALQAAEFALLSYGPNKSWDRTTRADAQGKNKDNIVEVGP